MWGYMFIVFSSINIVLSLAALIIQSLIHRAERKELYSRIMARDLNEYEYHQTNKTKETNKPRVETNLLKKRIDNSYRAQSGGEE